MIQTDKLVQFYCAQYKTFAKKKHKKTIPETGPYPKRMQRLSKELLAIHSPKIKQPQLENYHRQLRNLAYFVYRDANPIYIMQFETYLVAELVRLDISSLRDEEPELITERFLNFLYQEMPLAICRRTLKDLCHQYGQFGMRHQIVGMVPLKPETEFPQTRGMQRHFILHVGPTNCGKTYHALERLKEASCGVYLGPLRLLALEIHEKMKDAGIACTMLTGEECIPEENSRITSSTIEMLDMEQHYDIAVIDEAQMIADRDRGHSWTRAILGVKADEIHICMSPAAEEVVTHLIALCEDTFEVRHYERKTALVCEQEAFVFPDDVTEGDALITFTKRAVLDIAGRLEREGIRASVIYGSLPPEIRRRQIRLFLSHETKVVVSTDAIGMGLNLPVRRIVFIQTEKYDGISTRPLYIPEIRQIAGRAGRFGMYDTGYVNAMGEDARNYIAKRFDQPEPVIKKVSLGFPHVLLDMDEPLNAILKIWKSVEPSAPFEKISIDEILFLYDKAYKARKEIDGFEDKHTLYRMLTCSIDIKNRDIVDLWLYYCKTYTADVSLHFPSLIMCNDKGLMRYETFYKMLDLYHQFSTRMGKISDSERLNREREKTEDTIMKLLAKDKKDYIRTCKYCGVTLPVGYPFRVCEKCYGHSPYKKI
jgi:ATP-dependent RNA helicase SUPV3L1/SUV3